MEKWLGFIFGTRQNGWLFHNLICNERETVCWIYKTPKSCKGPQIKLLLLQTQNNPEIH